MFTVFFSLHQIKSNVNYEDTNHSMGAMDCLVYGCLWRYCKSTDCPKNRYGCRIFGEESIIARNPEVIFIPSDSPVTAEDVKNRSGWQDISAVKNNRIFKIDGDITSRSGPRIKEAILLINEFLTK